MDPFTGFIETVLGNYSGDIPGVGTIQPTVGDFAYATSRCLIPRRPIRSSLVASGSIPIPRIAGTAS